MKINIMTVKYNKDPNTKDKCTWFTWKETCDNCGNVISESNNLITNMYPNTEEKDYCLNCMRKYIDDRDDYISDDVREVLLQARKDKAEGKLKTTPLRDLRK